MMLSATCSTAKPKRVVNPSSTARPKSTLEHMIISFLTEACHENSTPSRSVLNYKNYYRIRRQKHYVENFKVLLVDYSKIKSNDKNTVNFENEYSFSLNHGELKCC